MLCSTELITDYLHNTRPNRDLITRIIAGDEVGGINYTRKAHKTHKYVSFTYIYNQRSYIIEISCNVIDGYLTTVDNSVCTKQDVYETIFAHDKSYIKIITREYFDIILRDISKDNDINTPTIDTQRSNFVANINSLMMLKLKVKFGRFDFSELWEMEKTLAETPDTWHDHEIDITEPIKLNSAGEISPKIATCRYPLIVNGGRAVDKLNYPIDEITWALKSIYLGAINTYALTHLRVALLNDLGINIVAIIASCLNFIRDEKLIYAVEFCVCD